MKQRRKRLMCLMLSAVLAVSTEAAAFADELIVDTATEDTVVTQELPEESPEAEDAAPAEEDDLIAEPEDGSSEISEAGEGFEAEDTADTEDASSLAEFSGDGLIVDVEEVESPELAVYATSNSEEMTTEDGQFTYIVMTDDTTGTQTAAITGYAGESPEGVQNIRIPEKIGDIPVTEIRSDFSNCTSLESLYIPQYVSVLGYSSVAGLNGANPKRYDDYTPAGALGPAATTFVAYEVSEQNPYFSVQDGVLYNKDKTVLYKCPIGKTTITIPDTVNVLYAQSFRGCQISTPLELTTDIAIGTAAFTSLNLNRRTTLTSVTVKKGNSDEWVNSYNCFESARIGTLSLEEGITSFGAKGMLDNVHIDILKLPGSLTKTQYKTFEYTGNNAIKDLYYAGNQEEWNTLTKKIYELSANNKKVENYHFCDHLNKVSEIVKEGTDSEDGLERTTCQDCGRRYDTILETAIWKFQEYNNKTSGNVEARIVAYRRSDAEVTIPTEWNGLPVTQIYSKVFKDNKTLQKVIVPEGILSIYSSNFSGCTNLKEISLPKSLTSISSSAFANSGLESLIVPNGITSIPASFVSGCVNLKKLILPNTITKIGSNAFNGCSDDIEIIYQGTKEEWNAIAITATGNELLDTSKNVKICDHSNISVINHVDATCTTEGYTGDKQCDTCKKIVEEGTVIPMEDHTPVVDAAVAPTCTEAGLTEGSHCEVCNTTITAQTVVLALGHDYAADYTVDTAPTCTAAGFQSRHCTRCGAGDETSKQEVAALGHDYVSKVTTAPTCTKDGVQTDTCSRCGDVQTTALKATGHQWSNWTKISDATVFATEQQQRTCQTCGEKETKEVGATLAPTATVNASTVTLKVKQSTKGLKVTDLAAGDSVASWKSTNTKVFTVKGNADGTCTLKGMKKGSAKLEITLASGMMKIITVKVQPSAVKTTKVTVPAKKLTVQKGTKASLKPVVTPFTSLQKVTYTSSNKKVVTVTKRGVITAKQAGTAKITIKSGSKKAVVTVTVPKTKTTGITVTKEVTVKKGKTYSLKAKVAPKNSDEKITYTSANKKVATVSKTGKIKGVKKGTTTITVKSGSQTVKVQVTVK